MNLPVLKVETWKARQAVREYRAAVRQKVATEEDKAVLSAYREICRGKTVISILDSLKNGGFDVLSALPKLAIGRADWKRVRFESGQPWSELRFYDTLGSPYSGGKSLITPSRVRVSRRFWPTLRNNLSATAIVPTIPPRFRPEKLSDYWILWEADWARPPVDPALLKHLYGPFFAVVAVWDLTAVERAALELR